MKKILFCVNHDLVIYNFRKELVETCLKEGYKVIIASPYGPRIDDLVAMGCDYVPMNINRHGTNPIEELKLLYHYVKLIKKVQPNVVLTYTIKPNIYASIAAQSLNIPVIANITGLGTAVENKGFMQKLSVLLYRFAFAKIHTVFFQNQDNQSFFEQHNIALGKHILIPGSGVNLHDFKVLPYPNEEVISFLFISRIMKEKGIDHYLEAAKIIKEKYPHTQFHILGFCEQDYEETLMSYQQANVITYHGMQKDIQPFLEKSHCTIHPSYYPEGISNVLLESSACGRPIITTNRSGCKEVVDEGKNGYLVNIKDTTSLVKAIESFISLSHEEKKTMGLNGRSKVEKEFDRNSVVQAYMERINQI